MIHEIIGHAFALATPQFSSISEQIGLETLQTEDDRLERLTKLYWITSETGLCLEDGRVKIYGAAILSSPSETENCLSKLANLKRFEA